LVAALYREPRFGNRGTGVSREVATCGQRRPHATAISQAKDRPLRLTPRDHVLIEPELAAGAQHAPQLRQRALLVGLAAQDEAHDRGVQLAVRERQSVREPREHRDGYSDLAGGLRRESRNVVSGSMAATSVTVGG